MDYGGRDQYTPDMSLLLEDEEFNKRQCVKPRQYDMSSLKLQDPPPARIPFKEPRITKTNYEQQGGGPYSKEKFTMPFNNDATIIIFIIFAFIIYIILLFNSKLNEIQFYLREIAMRQKI